MASYQDLETRVIGLEERMEFLLKAIPITLQVHSKVVGPDGQPTVEAKRTNMAELYRMQRAARPGATAMIGLDQLPSSDEGA